MEFYRAGVELQIYKAPQLYLLVIVEEKPPAITYFLKWPIFDVKGELKGVKA